MWYLVKESGKVFGTCNIKPNVDDLATRDEIAIEKKGLTEDIKNLQGVKDSNSDIVDVELKPIIELSIDKVQIKADGVDTALITATIKDKQSNILTSATDEVVFKTNGKELTRVSAVDGIAELEFSSTNVGIYTITTDNQPKYRNTSVEVEVV